ncbi:MAG: 6-bladed beta-propeller [Armatimonadetes bacterium]|nr:6-bladed beta-propeller [Armatimonadota bacterium]
MLARYGVLLVCAVAVAVLLGCGGANNGGPPPLVGPEFVFERIIGATGGGDGQFSGPCDVAADTAGALYVADAGNNRVEKLDATGAFVKAFGALGSRAGEFRNPGGMAVSGSTVYVADTGNTRVQVFTSDGSFLREFGSRWTDGGSLREPRALAVSTSAVAVGDRQQHRVVVYDMNGNVVRSIGGLGIGDGEFLEVSGVAISGSSLYVADRDRNDIQVFNLADGSYQQTLGQAGSDPGRLRGPVALAATTGGLFVLDAGNERVQLLALTGAPQSVVEPETTPAGSLVNPSGIAAWRGGFVVADTGNDRLVSFQPQQATP